MIPQMRPPGNMIDGLIELIKDAQTKAGKLELEVVEIGSFAGESARIFLENGCKIHCVDPYIGGYDTSDPAANRRSLALALAQMNELAAQHPTLTLVKETSLQASAKFSPLSVDLVYIDGEHRYPAVLQDIKAWQLIPRIAVAGHDYWMNEVAQAVDEVFVKPDKTYSDSSWIKFQTN